MRWARPWHAPVRGFSDDEFRSRTDWRPFVTLTAQNPVSAPIGCGRFRASDSPTSGEPSFENPDAAPKSFKGVDSVARLCDSQVSISRQDYQWMS
jgi:hypothetical protein